MSRRIVVLCCLLGSAASAQTRVAPIVTPAAAANADLRQNVSPGAAFSGLGAVSPNLVIGPGDLLIISAFDIPELAAEVRVSNSGEIDYPLLGSVKVLGMTATQAANDIASRLKAGGFVLNPQISLAVKEFATQGVSVLGEVRRPGSYPLVGTHTLLDVITAAEGLTSFANRTVTITHSGDREPSTYTIDTRPGQSWKVNPLVEAGDRIEVGRAGVVYVLGDVSKPGGFVVENGEGMTVLKAVALAGGHNRTATLAKARLIRKTESGTEDTKISVKDLLAGKQPDLQLHDNDILYIPGSEAKSMAIRSVESMISALGYTAIYAAR